MPRPKRDRATTRTRPMATAATGNSSSPPPIPVLPKPAQAERAGTELPSDIYDVSDAEKERRKLRASAKKSAAAEQQHTLELEPDQVRALDSSRKQRDDALARLRDVTSASKDGSELDVTLGTLDDDSSLGLGDESTEVEGVSRATDTSTFNIAGFKRRPRQSSVQGRGESGLIRPSSRGQGTPSISTTISFGRFKRRQREPSILGTGRKERRVRSVSRGSQAGRNREVLGREDEGEVSPVDGGKRRSTRGRSRGVESVDGSPVAAGSRKRKSLESHEDGREKRLAVDGGDMEMGSGDGPDLDFDIDAELEPRVESPAREQQDGDVHQSIELDEQPPISSPLSTPPRELSAPPQLSEDNDPDMAPPLSSSPASEAGSPVAWPSLDALAQRKYNTRTVPSKTPELEDDGMGSNISSPPSLTHSPNYRAKSKPPVVKKRAPPPPKSSADLASLLPRRKTSSKNKNRKGSHSADPFDIDDGEASEEEEAPPPTRRAAKKPLSKTASTANKGKQKESAVAADPKGKKKRVTRTYGSKAHEQEKENDGDVDGDREGDSIVVGSGSNEPEDEEEEELPEAETTVMLKERLGEELQKAVKKFKEVDQWELSFEEVEGSSSPMRDAR
ncbi:uncharacterized protein PODANS_7_8480 [Podospora anserina S mat+]|uniref:Podospora anserina S mat+ genomic DNA chromosome 7, supercontig 1 n=1 Tax=Podospora anserina (strain S / ATCC MYA-4624 / DSM 980 / FGSC 10383) TaxID=515849 RepID=B2AWV8_PODAN|nr:uncharacterized protein PODANS_7_8480 [Podospora anserina S mat+]CAP68882.1 unnamed protein product [Podospora anserina S mat+]CDP32354.1 Putative protein of unknown function [Podospora anserina S mat+]